MREHYIYKEQKWLIIKYIYYARYFTFLISFHIKNKQDLQVRISADMFNDFNGNSFENPGLIP